MSRVSRDSCAEKEHYLFRGYPKEILKLRKLNEPGGVPMDICSHIFDIHALSNFGMGIALYFNSLIMFSVISLLSGAILLPSMMTFSKSSYGIGTDDPRLEATAACDNSEFASANCNFVGGATACNFICGGDTCDLLYRPHCEYPGYDTAYPDLAMCAFFAFSLIATELYQNYLQKSVDKEVQTAQDYSLVVWNPPSDAVDPDEWEDFFSRFGTVRYVTVVRNNKNLMRLLLKKRLIVRGLMSSIPVDTYDRRAAAISSTDPSLSNYVGWIFGCGKDTEEYRLRQLAMLNVRIHEECQLDHSVCWYGCLLFPPYLY